MVQAACKAPGNYYFNFYLEACAMEGDCRVFNAGLDKHLTIYQDHVGMPAWSAGEQLALEISPGTEVRTIILFARSCSGSS